MLIEIAIIISALFILLYGLFGIVKKNIWIYTRYQPRELKGIFAIICGILLVLYGIIFLYVGFSLLFAETYN